MESEEGMEEDRMRTCRIQGLIKGTGGGEDQEMAPDHLPRLEPRAASQKPCSLHLLKPVLLS